MIKAEGILAHHFHGSYWATVVLSFESEQAARNALPQLGNSWSVGQRSAKLLVCNVSGDELDALKEKLAGFRLAMKPCEPHSVDVGEEFTVEIPYGVPEEQGKLFP